MGLRRIGLAGLALVACELDSSGVGTSPSLPAGGDDATGGSTSTEPGPDAADVTTPAGGTGDDAQLVISDAPTYDFGRLTLGEARTGTLTVRNLGGTEATGLEGRALSDPFSYEGGRFPGTGGDCGSTLGPEMSCAVAVTFRPLVLGTFEQTLVLTYDGGPDATRPLQGTGRSDNLLENPDGEQFGTPPPGWLQVGSGDWVAGDPWEGEPPVFMGRGYLGAHSGNFGYQEYQLRQDVELDSWADLIDAGSLRITFEGHARSFQSDNDDYRFSLQYRGDQGALDSWSIDWQTSITWELIQHDRVIPSGTRAVRVVLWCRKFQTPYCDAFFDELDLRVTGS